MYAEGKQWKEDAQMAAKLTHKEPPTKKELLADITFYLKRDRDCMGSGKLILDSFQGIVYENDSQFTHVTFHKIMDKQNPRVEIRIEEI